MDDLAGVFTTEDFVARWGVPLVGSISVSCYDGDGTSDSAAPRLDHSYPFMAGSCVIVSCLARMNLVARQLFVSKQHRS